jgi:hypothetical protein
MKLVIRFIGNMGIVEYDEETWTKYDIQNGMLNVYYDAQKIGVYNMRYVLAIQQVDPEVDPDLCE